MVGWRSWLCVCVPGEGVWVVVGRNAVLQLCVRLSMSEWIRGGRVSQGGGIQVQKCWSIKSLSLPLSLSCWARRKATAICAISQLTESLKLWQPCAEVGGGNEGVGGRDGRNEEKCRDGRMERQTLQTRKWQWKVKMDRLEEKQAADDWSEGEETGTQEICILHF